MDRVEDDVVDSFFDADSERRSADHVPVAVRAVVDSVVEAVLDAPVGDAPETDREVMDPVAVAVRVMSPEVARTVIFHEWSLARRNPVDIPVVTDPHEIAPALLHDVCRS